MRSRALLTYGGVVLAGIGTLIAVGGFEGRSQAFTLGVLPSAPVVRVSPAREVCQRPIEVVEKFNRIALRLDNFGRSFSPFVLQVRNVGQEAPLVKKRVEGVYLDDTMQTVVLPRGIPAGEQIAVCVRNVGRRAIAAYGNSGAANGTSAAYLDGRRLDADMTLLFLRSEPATTLSLVPSIVERASLFHGEWTSPAAYWVLLALILTGPTLLVGLAVRRACADQA
jgi:hypothetical protein